MIKNEEFRRDLNFFYQTKLIRLGTKTLLLPFATVRWFWRHVILHIMEIDVIEIVVSPKCTLRCKHCANLMQYYPKPQDFPVEQLLSDIDSLLQLDLSIQQVNLIGGEPFLYRELPRLIERIAASPKVKTIRIITNGTIIPPPSFFPALNHPKLHIFISNYVSIGAKTNQVLDFLQKQKTNVQIVSYPWLNYHHNFSGYHRTVEENTAIYRKCGMACHEMLNGEIHLCPTSSNGMNLGLIPRDPDSFVSIRHDGSRPQKRKILKDLRHLFTVQVPNACDYCYGGKNGEIIPVAEQLPPHTYLVPSGEIKNKK